MFIDPLLNPLLALDPLISILILTLVISFIVTLIYKYTTDQKKMKELKDKMTAHQKSIKENKHDTKKVMQLQKEVMDFNMQYMMHSFRATLFTFIPVILFFGWMTTHYSYEPILPGQEFNVTAYFNDGFSGNVTADGNFTFISNKTQTIAPIVSWRVKGNAGINLMTFSINQEEKPVYNTEILIDSEKYSNPIKTFKKMEINKIIISNKPLKLMNLFGIKFNWFWTYFLFTLIFTSLLRKFMRVY